MTFGSVCSGIEAATVAWDSLGWKAAWYSEIEPFPCRLLNHYYPDTPNLGDMRMLSNQKVYNESTIDILVGGTPCQSFSIAGLRAGLNSENGNLALEYCRILLAKRPKWFVWENVPGALSSFSNESGCEGMEGEGQENGKDITETADFATLLTAFRECGYSCAWRVLDAQYFGVPQRRRRIFVVGYLGNDWRPPAAVLFEPEGVRRDIKKGRKKRKDIAGCLESCTKGGGFPGSDGAMSNHVVPMFDAVPEIRTRMKGDNVGAEGHLIVSTLDANYGKLQGCSGQDLNHNHSHLIAYPLQQITSVTNRSNPKPGDPCPTITKGSSQMVIVPGVRRLTPLECERLQGFPDGYTNIPGASDTARYQALGNSMPVPVMRWIGKRIDVINKHLNK